MGERRLILAREIDAATRVPWTGSIASLLRRMAQRLCWAALLLPALGPPALARTVPGEHFNDWYETRGRDDDGLFSEFSLINYFFVRLMASNMRPDPSGLRGVSLGPFGIGQVGSATRVGGGETYLVEQRWIPVIAVTPFFTDGWADFRAMLEIDFSWGFSANAVQPNQGGGFGADQVNIQTKDVYVAIFPTRKSSKLALLVGTQPFFDSIYNPHTTPLFDIVRSGYKLSFMATDATGISLYSSYFGVLAKAAFIPLNVAQPHKALDDDPGFAFTTLITTDVALPVQPGSAIGLSYWHLRDDTEGQAFAFEGLVRAGPSGGLATFNGNASMNLLRPTGYVHYVGLNFHHNLRFYTGPFAASGFLMFNFGRYEAQDERSPNQQVKLWGFAANLEGAYNFGKSPDDVLTLEMMLSNGDNELADGVQRGPFTLNNYGLAGATWFNHKTLLLFPFTSVATNFTGAVTDLHNQGYGLVALIGSGSYDLIPFKLNLKLGAAFGMSFAEPPDFAAADPQGTARDRGRIVGTELNVELKYHLRYLMTVGLHAAVMFTGDFYEGNALVIAQPWAAFTTFTWYAF